MLRQALGYVVLRHQAQLDEYRTNFLPLALFLLQAQRTFGVARFEFPGVDETITNGSLLRVIRDNVEVGFGLLFCDAFHGPSAFYF